MSEETKDIEETKVAEEKKMETEQTILSQPTEKKGCRDSDTDSTNRWRYRSRKEKN